MIAFHTVLASIALLLGPAIFWRSKGCRWHRRAGYGFAAAILGTDLSAFTIYELTGGVNVIHLLAVINLATLAFALRAARSGRVADHLDLMIYVYAGLIAALATRLQPLLPFDPWVSFALLAAAAVLGTQRALKRLLSKDAAITQFSARNQGPQTIR